MGLIPAHAGKTIRAHPRPTGGRAHPRSRGENAPIVSVLPFSQGSSPLTRGKRPVAQEPPGGSRLIPAHAGKTRDFVTRFCYTRAHPRSRGENMPEPGRLAMRAGSSPLTRGKRHLLRPRLRERGLIPAHAGKTSLMSCSSGLVTAHPRSRGENSPNQGYEAKVSGSSPLTRGKPASDRGTPWGSGLIPAHAGKTHVGGAALRHIGAHPRSRGENCDVLSLQAYYPGSSPLTRGKQRARSDVGRRVRLIPAHAGKTAY